MYVFFCTSNVSLYHVNRLKQYCFHPFHLSSLRFKHLDLEPVFRPASDVRISKREGFQIYFKPQVFIDTTLSIFRHKLLTEQLFGMTALVSVGMERKLFCNFNVSLH